MKRSLPVQIIFREYFEGVVAAIFLAIFLRFFVFSIFFIPGLNMQPELLRGDFVVGWKLAYGLPIPLRDGERLNPKVPRRGDVISLRFPGDTEQILIRRVIGLPGENVAINRGKVVVNDRTAEYVNRDSQEYEAWGEGQTYQVSTNQGEDMAVVQVPADHIFVLSDNRMQSDDSRSWGMVPVKNIDSQIAYIWLSIDGVEGRFAIRWPRLFKKIR